MPFERTLAEVFGAHGDALRDEIRVMLPATVTAIHATTQTVDVKIAIKNPLADQYGEVSFEEMPGLSDVPLGIIRGGGFFVWVPVAIGDSVMLIFSDLSWDTWRSGVTGSGPIEPGWVGKHTFDSPVAIPCVSPDIGKLVDPATAGSKVVIGKDGSQAQIRISDTEIDLGKTATDAIALASKIDALITVLMATYTPSGTESGFLALFTALQGWKTTYGWGTTTTTIGATLAKAE